VETGHEIVVLWGHTDWVRSVASLPDDKYIASGTRDTSNRIWDISIMISAHQGSITDAVALVDWVEIPALTENTLVGDHSGE
jgi:WD40 repeat protein